METIVDKKTGIYDKNPALIKSYREGNESAGEEIVILNRPLVCSIAARFSGRGVDMEDLVGLGNVGLVKAIKTFDQTRGCAFSTYAVPLIFGEIRRFLRDDGLIKVSREEKRLSALIIAERERRLAAGEDARISEIAAACGVSVNTAVSALFASAPVRSLDEAAYAEDDSVTLGAVLCDEEQEGRDFDRLSISLAIEKLPPTWRKLIVLRYFRDYSQARCAELLGMTQVKVSREEKKILAALKKELS
jgi:RNA polymerase sporulation-specific sigma factor